MTRLERVAMIGLLVGCGTTTGSEGGEASQTTGALAGSVAIGPICPVETEDPCPVPPELYGRVEVVVLDERSRVRVTELDDEGGYTIDLAAGRYRVTIAHDLGIPPGSASLHVVDVRVGETTIQDFSIDTGIR